MLLYLSTLANRYPTFLLGIKGDSRPFCFWHAKTSVCFNVDQMKSNAWLCGLSVDAGELTRTSV